MYRGIFFKAKSLYKEALKNFTISLTMEPNYVPSIVSMADLLMNAGRGGVPVASSLLLNAVQVEPINHDAWFKLGLVAKREGLLSEAADCFQASFELKSSAPVQPFQ
ncbi:hypothetical protein Droror1_Dr00012344 [Drosera rotundifolia]